MRKRGLDGILSTVEVLRYDFDGVISVGEDFFDFFEFIGVSGNESCFVFLWLLIYQWAPGFD